MQEDVCRICKHYTILFRGLKHPQVLVSTVVLEPIPYGYGGTAVYISAGCLSMSEFSE